MSEQFTVGGQSIPSITTGYGAFLVVWGVVISLVSGSESIILLPIFTWSATFDIRCTGKQDS